MNRFYRWYQQSRFAIKQLIFPLIILQFIKTLFMPTPLDIIILFLFFLLYIGILMEII